MLEVEVKIKADSLDTIRSFLLNNGFTVKAKLTETDMYFDSIEGNIRNSDRALRIREIEDHMIKSKGNDENHYSCNRDSCIVQMNYKGPKTDSHTMTREEHEITISDAGIGRCILEGLGFHAVEPVVRKHRMELGSPDGKMTICLDCVEGLGTFMELEIVEDLESTGADDYEKMEHIKTKALQRIENMIGQLGYNMSDSVTTSYLSMLEHIQYETLQTRE